MKTTENDAFQIEILELRNQLNYLDEMIIDALISRFIITDKVGILKHQYNKPVLDQTREDDILNKLKILINSNVEKREKRTSGDEAQESKESQARNIDQYIIPIYEELLSQSRKKQSVIVNESIECTNG